MNRVLKPPFWKLHARQILLIALAALMIYDVFGTHGLACFERVLRRLADQLLYAADRQIASRVGPQLQRDEHQQGDGQVIDGDLCQQLSSAHALPPLVMLVFMPVMMVVMMLVLADRITGNRLEHAEMLG